MKKLIFLVLLIVAFAYYKHSAKHQDAEASTTDTQEQALDVGHGFVKVAMPDESNPNEALVLSPLNCTSEEVAMGEQLEAALKAAGVPAKRSENFGISIQNPTEAQKAAMNKSMELFQSKPPVVFINGYAKSRPSVNEVLAVYQLGINGINGVSLD